MIRSEDLKIPESMAQDFGFTVALGKQEHSKLRNCYSSADVGDKRNVIPAQTGTSQTRELSVLKIKAYRLKFC